MKALIYYLVQVIIASGILYSYYHLFLRNKKFHRYNRAYILMATLVSIFIPFLNIPVYFTHDQAHSSIILYSLSNITVDTQSAGNIIIKAQPENLFTWQNILYAIYILIASVVLLKTILSLRKIRLIIRRNPVEKVEKIKFVNTDEPGTPFSFFNWLFWNRKIELRSEKGEQIFRHELFHIEQKHSWDILFMELASVVFWINPFFFLMKKELKAIHEFLADQFAVNENGHWEYAELLLMQALNTHNSLVNPFFHNQIKRRIAMLATSTKPGQQYLRKVLVLPVAAIVLALVAFKYKEKENSRSHLPPGKTYTVVIDAGHGGSEPGTTGSDGTLEKNIVLEIAQKVKSLNTDDNLNILLTRDGDATIPLQNRTALSNENNADLFISFHVNAQAPSTGISDKKSGIEVYVPYFNKTYYSENRILGSILLNYLYQVHTTTMSIQTRSKNKIWILENTRCPSAMVELGYMTDNNDLNFITQPGNQEKIAEAVLQSIDQYFLQKENVGREERKIEMTDTIPAITAITLKQEMNSKGAIIIGGKQNNSFSILSDTIIFKSDSQNADLKDALIFFNGKEIASKNISNKTVIAKRISIYPKNDPEAIQKFGAGAKKGVIVFEDAKIQEPKVIEVTLVDTIGPDNKVFEKPEIEASFQGGDMAWRKYLERNLTGFDPAKNGAPNGTYTVYIQFIVDEDGNIRDVRPLTHFGYGMEEKAVSIIQKGPRWTPAIQNGRKVTAYRKQPVTFVVDGTVPVGKTLTEEKNQNFTKSISDDKKIFEKPEIHASFPGGDEAWRKFLTRSLSSYNPADSGAPSGTYTVIAQFIVETDGTLQDIKALTHFGFGMENKVIEMLKKGPNWTPAIQNGRKVAAYVKQPVTFVVQDEDEGPGNGLPDPGKLSKDDMDRLPVLYPDPARNSITVNHNSASEGNGEIRVYDSKGLLKISSPVNFLKGDNSFSVDISPLTNGIYFVYVIGANKKIGKSYKLIKE
ncbi:MAG: N-acetylmuramoyl-L-alanine amidase [Chitinophagales bacterium]|nr:N-acetylmuramoyl-L-alanine amidase [Chitinophagales bacterium]